MKAKLLALFAAIKADLADTWNRSKIFILGVGALILALEFNKIWENIQVYLAQRQFKVADTKDQQLKDDETSLNSQANILVKDANNLPESDKTVDINWYKKDSK